MRLLGSLCWLEEGWMCGLCVCLCLWCRKGLPLDYLNWKFVPIYYYYYIISQYIERDIDYMHTITMYMYKYSFLYCHNLEVQIVVNTSMSKKITTVILMCFWRQNRWLAPIENGLATTAMNSQLSFQDAHDVRWNEWTQNLGPDSSSEKRSLYCVQASTYCTVHTSEPSLEIRGRFLGFITNRAGCHTNNFHTILSVKRILISKLTIHHGKGKGTPTRFTERNP
jgi:hypothetical protein